MFEDDIHHAELVEALTTPGLEVLEDYPEDARGHSCLVWSKTAEARVIHTVIGLSGEPLKIVTVYVPNAGEFEPPDFKIRRKQ